MGKVRRGNLRGEEEREDQGDETPRAARRCSGVDGVVWRDGRNWRRTAAFLHDAARCRLALGVVEHVFQAHIVVHTPVEVLVEGRGAGEHPPHAPDALDRPTTEVLIERLRFVKSGVHVLDAIDRPITDVSVKGGGPVEHPVRARHAGGVPRADVVVEGRRGRVAVTAPTI